MHNGAELPNYFDPQYGCEMAVLRFDTECYAAKYHSAVTELRNELRHTPVISPLPSRVAAGLYPSESRAAGALVAAV